LGFHPKSAILVALKIKWVSVIHICSCMLVARPITNFVTGVLYVLPELIPKSCFVFTVLLHSKFQTLSWSEIDLIKISGFTESKCRIVLTDSTIGISALPS
jgi:hypothetical protein